MGRRKLKVILILVGLVLVSVGFVVLGNRDPLREVRLNGGVETVYKDAHWIGHEFQFSEPCSVVQTKLADWKKSLENGGREFKMTDMDDLDMGPMSWARLEDLNIVSAVDLRPGMKCGFIVFLQDNPSWLDGFVIKAKQILHLE